MRYIVIIANSDLEFDSAIKAVWVFETQEAANQFAYEYNTEQQIRCFEDERERDYYPYIFPATNHD
jgi:nuclear transport factor 2 (NTF2) superfamily protein